MTALLLYLLAAIGAFTTARFCWAAFKEVKRGAQIGYRAYTQPQALTRQRLEELQHISERKRVVVLSPSARDTRH